MSVLAEVIHHWGIIKAFREMPFDEIEAEVCHGGSSVQRTEILLCALASRTCNGAEFWRLFNEWWCCCDRTWWGKAWLLEMLRSAGDSRPHMPEDDAAFYDSLPETITIYRGCQRDRVRGVSWTTDREIAEKFAIGHRFIAVPNPVMASALICKEHVFTAIAGRDESEVIIDPRRLRRLAAGPGPVMPLEELAA